MKQNYCKMSGIILLISIISLCFSANAATRQMEYLDRGVVAVKVSGGVYVSWRYLGTDDPSVSFNLYRNGQKVNSAPIATKTNYTDAAGTTSSVYTVRAIAGGIEQPDSKSAGVWAQQYKTIQLKRPAGGSNPSGSYTYTPNDCSVGDVDGDGEYEIIVKWDPSNAKDNSQSGYTGNVYLDCYKINGTFMWRIDLGVNIRAGAHYTQFQVYDLDGDGKAEIACKTAPGTIDGKGKRVLMGSDDPSRDYRNSGGYVLSGPEYLTVFSGETGAELSTVAYNPPRGTVSSWGDNYGNRVDRFLACVAYLDGVRPSLVMCRGYYTRSVLTAYDFRNGKLTQRWYHNSATSGSGAYGQGNHNLAVADVDGDGYDEIIYGAACIDHNGNLLYRTGFGHGDAMHISDMDPDRAGLEGWFVHEDKGSAYGFELRDLKTGKVIFGQKTGSDVGRGLAADIDPNHRGFEMWSTGSNNVYDCKGNVISTSRPSVNFRIYWDGDLQDELLDGDKLDKWTGNGTTRLFSIYNSGNAQYINGTKANPCLSADILGDWREEMIFYNGKDPSQLLLFTTVIPTEHRLFTLMHDPVYRMSVAWQNTAYNQPPHLGFYIGDGVDNIPQPDIYLANHTPVDLTPTLTKNGAGGSSQTVVSGSPIIEFSYTWTNAATVNVDGMPPGINVNIDNAAQRVSFSGTPSASGTFPFTVTTVSGSGTEASKSGTITVEKGEPEPATIGRWGPGGARNQTVVAGNPINSIIFNFANATSIEVIGTLPEGVTGTITGNQLSINGTPHEVGVFSFTLRTVGGQPDATDPGGTITVTEDMTVAKLEVEGDLYQTVFEGESMEELIFVWGGGTNDVEVTGLPDGLIMEKKDKSLVIKGRPTTSGTIVIKTIGNGEPITIESIITVIPSSLKKVAYVTDMSAVNYSNDTRILPALMACSGFYIKEIDAQQQGVDFSIFDLVVISEVAASNSPIMPELKGVEKPVLTMKVHAYKSTDETWNWATTGYGDNTTATTLVVENDMLQHPMFKDVTFVNGNEIRMISSVNVKALTYMNPVSFIDVSGGEIQTIAKIKDAGQTCILEIPAGTMINGTLLPENYVQIGLNSSSYANITDEGVSVVLNACYYLLGMLEEEGEPTLSRDILSEEEIWVYPNPVKEQMTLVVNSLSAKDAVLTIYNMLGQPCFSRNITLEKGKKTYSFDRPDIQPGVYMLNVNLGENACRKAVVFE